MSTLPTIPLGSNLPDIRVCGQDCGPFRCEGCGAKAYFYFSRALDPIEIPVVTYCVNCAGVQRAYPCAE